MRARLPVVLMTVFVLLGTGVPAFAHHAFGVEFDSTKCLDLKGTLKGVLWENPHAYIDVDVTDADGKTVTWHLEMVTPNALTRNGTPRTDFVRNIGKPINVRACRSRVEGDRRGAASYLQLPDGEIRGVGQQVERRAPEDRHF
jgi:hypothetical protein